MVAAELGHEVKNVLMVIEALGSLLVEELPANGDGVHIVEELRHVSARASRLSHRLMQLARDSTSEEPADLAAALSCMVATLKRIAKNGVAVELDVIDTHVWTRLCAIDAQQVVFNLAHNAFDAMSSGGSLVICLRVYGNTALLTLRDSGAGMDPDTLRRCFEPFFTTKGANGTGLGLHAARDAVERAGGRAVIESTAGDGTAVSIYLPILKTGTTS